ncbi:MAG: efflux RND transporter periplasmic adaptor subunit [Alcanivoracaceae bacterium]|jgi:RND family efflux transporter MFP subunit|nr:efflux RND transporter periplasmic adaptor subunit [Alcanivoracaceae bacterium]
MNQVQILLNSLRQHYQRLSVPVRIAGWVVLALLIILLARCGSNSDDQTVESLRPVKLYQVGESNLLTVRHFVGRVDAVSTVDLSFQVGGRIIDLPVQQGSIQRAGSLIAALDPADYQLAVREAELQLEQANRDLERARSLFERGSVSQASLDQAQTAHNLRRVALDTARRNLAYTRITAPFDALVTRRLVDPFTNVQPNMQIVRVQNVEEFRVHISVPENLMGAMDQADSISAEAVFQSRPDKPVALTYREHETEPDAVAQTYRVTFGMPRDEEFNVLPGMTVTVRLRAAVPDEVAFFDIPPSALDSDEQGNFRVWVYQSESGAVTPRAVKMLGLNEEGAALVVGLNGDEQIVSAGLHLLHDGMRVLPFEGF